jgi:hypothetical protein
MTMDRRLVTLVAMILAAACTRAPAQQAAAPASAPAPSVVTAWLDCVECTQDQLNALVSAGNSVVPELSALLSNGPPQATLDRERAFLQSRYQKIVDYARQHPGGPPVALTQDQYVQQYLQVYVLRTRMRSARALGAIATADAKDALKKAQQLPNLTDELKYEINLALNPPTP